MKNKIIYTSIGAAIIIIVASILLLLIPVEKKQKLYEKYGVLAERAENDEKSAYILDNIDLFPNDILEFYYKDYDKNIDFVYNYPEHKDDYQNMKFTDEELNSDTIPALYMDDSRWGYEKMGDSYIKGSGCFTVSLTMANLFLKHDDSVNPPKVASIAQDIGSLAMYGIDNSNINEICNQVGLKNVISDYSPESENSGKADINVIIKALDSGHAVMAGMIGDTFGAHAIVIRECSEDGTMYINDPANRTNTDKVWNFYELQPEIYFIWDLSCENAQ